MGIINLGYIEEGENESLKNSIKLYCDTEPSVFMNVVKELVDLPDLMHQKAIYIFGHGGKSKYSYNQIRKMSGVKVIWQKTGGGVILRPLLSFFSAQFGLIEFTDINKVPKVFEILSDMSMVGLYLFDRKLTKNLIAQVHKNGVHTDINYIISEDSGFLSFVIDGGNTRPSGFYAIIRYGKDCSRDIVKVVNKIKLPPFYFRDKHE